MQKNTVPYDQQKRKKERRNRVHSQMYSQGVIDFVAKSLSKDPSTRFQTAADMRLGLEHACKKRSFVFKNEVPVIFPQLPPEQSHAFCVVTPATFSHIAASGRRSTLPDEVAELRHHLKNRINNLELFFDASLRARDKVHEPGEADMNLADLINSKVVLFFLSQHSFDSIVVISQLLTALSRRSNVILIHDITPRQQNGRAIPCITRLAAKQRCEELTA